MPEVLDDRESHLLLLKDDGTTELVPKSDRNRLLWEYDLFPVLRDREHTMNIHGEDSEHVRIIPDPIDKEAAFCIETNEYVYYVPEHKTDLLVQMLIAAFEETGPPAYEPYPGPIVERLRELLDTEVDPDVVDPAADLPTFRERVDVTETGWLIHDHLLLTYDNEFYNLYTESKKRSGGEAVPSGSKEQAYRITTPPRSRFEDALSGKQRPADAEFLVRAIWGVDHTAP